MIFTLRFVTALVMGALMVGLSGWARELALAGMALSALAVVLALADWLWLMRARLDVTRTCDEKLSLGAENPVSLTLRNNGYTRLRGAIRDEHPEGMDARGSVIAIDLAPRSVTEFLYRVFPPRRGDYGFGDAYVRILGPLGFAMRQIRYPMRREVKVYPNLLDMRKYDLGLRRATQAGQRVTRMRGRGTDFESLRDYLPDDEFRSVDWKASARRAKLVVRQYQQERSQNVVIVLDCGRVMGPVIDGLTRLDHGINAAMMLAHVAELKGDKVGLMSFAEDIISYLPPRAGRSQTLTLLSTTYNLSDAEGESNYARALTYLGRRWTRRSLVLVFSDLVDPESSRHLIAHIASLTKRHLCACVTLADPAMIEAAYSDPKEPADAFRSAAARQALHARKLAAAQLARAGAIVIDAPPGKLTPAVVEGYLDIKARARL